MALCREAASGQDCQPRWVHVLVRSPHLADVPGLPCFTPSPRVLAHDGGEHRHYRDLLRRVCFRGPSFRHPIAAVTGLTMRSSRNRSEEHTSELQSLMRISYAVFCLQKKKHITHKP